MLFHLLLNTNDLFLTLSPDGYVLQMLIPNASVGRGLWEVAESQGEAVPVCMQLFLWAGT